MLVRTMHGFYPSALSQLLNQYVRESSIEEMFLSPNEKHDWLCRFMASKINLVMFIATFIEANLNLYLSFKLSRGQFKAVEQLGILEKATSLIEIAVPGYSVDRSASFFGDLRTLVATRNALQHLKPRITVREEILQDGFQPKHLQADRSDAPQLQKWCGLPERIMDHILLSDRSTAAVHTALTAFPNNPLYMQYFRELATATSS